MENLRPRSIGEIFDLALHVFWRDWRTVALPYAIGIVPLILVATFAEPQILYTGFLTSINSALHGAGIHSQVNTGSGVDRAPGWAAPLFYFLEFAIVPLAGIAASRGSRAAMLDVKTDLWTCLTSSLRKTGGLIALVLAWLPFLLAVACVFGVIVFATVFAMAGAHGLSRGSALPQDQLAGIGFALVAEAGVLILVYPIPLMLFSWSFAAFSLDDCNGPQAVLRSFQAIFNKRTFWRSMAIGAAAVALSIFVNGLEFAVTSVALGAWNARWLEAVAGILGDVSVAGISTAMYVAFFLDEKVRGGATLERPELRSGATG